MVQGCLCLVAPSLVDADRKNQDQAKLQRQTSPRIFQ